MNSLDMMFKLIVDSRTGLKSQFPRGQCTHKKARHGDGCLLVGTDGTRRTLKERYIEAEQESPQSGEGWNGSVQVMATSRETSLDIGMRTE
jgi:hypothetical protein